MPDISMTNPLMLIIALALAVVIGATLGTIFKPRTQPPGKGPALPFMANVHYLVWAGTTIILVIIGVEATGAELPDYVIGLVNVFIGGIGGAYGSIIQLYTDLYGPKKSEAPNENPDSS